MKKDPQKERKSILPILQKRRQEDMKARKAAISILLSLIPGSKTALEFFQILFSPELGQRQSEWYDLLGKKMSDEQTRTSAFDITNLARDEEFLSVLIQSSQSAFRTHSEEKRHLLANAVINSALKTGTDSTLQQAFIRFVDELDVLHVRLLAFVSGQQESLYGFEDCPTYAQLRVLFLDAHPDLDISNSKFELLVIDLKNRALLSVSERVDAGSPVFRYRQPRPDSTQIAAGSAYFSGPMFAVSTLGREFIEYISRR